jgi:hypothetical protein
MTTRNVLVACGACAAVAAPATAMAAGPLAAPAPLGNHTTVSAKMRSYGDALEARRHARERRRERARRARARRAEAASHTASPQLEAIAACESGGNPSTNTGNGFYGKYQFTQSTWESVGGTGNPAAAPEAEQDKRAAMLLAQSGSSPWPVCGH